MRERAQHPGMWGFRETDALLREPGERLVDVEAERADVDLHEVRLTLRESAGGAGRARPLGRPRGPRVIAREPLDVVVEGVDPRRSDDPGLAHRTAELVLET